jgi:hypothetical protein
MQSLKGYQLMRDTTPEMTDKMCEMIRRKSPIERLRMGESMYETSKYLIIRAILEDNPQISKTDLRKEIFLKFYANDYNLIQQQKIIKHLQEH